MFGLAKAPGTCRTRKVNAKKSSKIASRESAAIRRNAVIPQSNLVNFAAALKLHKSKLE